MFMKVTWGDEMGLVGNLGTNVRLTNMNQEFTLIDAMLLENVAETLSVVVNPIPDTGVPCVVKLYVGLGATSYVIDQIDHHRGMTFSVNACKLRVTARATSAGGLNRELSAGVGYSSSSIPLIYVNSVQSVIASMAQAILQVPNQAKKLKVYHTQETTSFLVQLTPVGSAVAGTILVEVIGGQVMDWLPCNGFSEIIIVNTSGHADTFRITYESQL